jgi:hypothetical protein
MAAESSELRILPMLNAPVLRASGGMPPAAAAKKVCGQHHRYLSEVLTSLLSRGLP